MIIKYGIIAIILLVLELFYFFIANKFNIIDKPNLRSSHTKATIIGGGIIFPIAMIVYSMFFGVSYIWFIVGLIVVCIVSFVDDIRSIPNSLRLVVQFAAIFLMFYQLGILKIEKWWIILITMIICIGIINVYNFMDGINGITGGYSMVVLASFLVKNSISPFIESSFIIMAMIAVLVFLLFNFRTKAKCFAGDVGSIGIAFIIIFILGSLVFKTGQFWYISFFAVYGVDAVLTIIHRLMMHENIGQAHRKHAYQIMANELHIPHLVIAGIYMVLQIIVSAGAILLPVNGWIYLLVVVVVLSLFYILFMKKYYYLHKEYLKSKERIN